MLGFGKLSTRFYYIYDNNVNEIKCYEFCKLIF